MSGIEVPALRGRPCTVTLPPRATPIMLGIHPYSVAGLTSIVQRTGLTAAWPRPTRRPRASSTT